MIDGILSLDATVVVAALALIGTVVTKRVDLKTKRESVAVETNALLRALMESNKTEMAQMTETYRINSRRLEEQIQELSKENKSLKMQMTRLVDENKELKGQIANLNMYLTNFKAFTSK